MYQMEMLIYDNYCYSDGKHWIIPVVEAVVDVTCVVVVVVVSGVEVVTAVVSVVEGWGVVVSTFVVVTVVSETKNKTRRA